MGECILPSARLVGRKVVDTVDKVGNDDVFKLARHGRLRGFIDRFSGCSRRRTVSFRTGEGGSGNTLTFIMRLVPLRQISSEGTRSPSIRLIFSSRRSRCTSSEGN